jgi:Ca2+-binding RTX toxin-like protein
MHRGNNATLSIIIPKDKIMALVTLGVANTVGQLVEPGSLPLNFSTIGWTLFDRGSVIELRAPGQTAANVSTFILLTVDANKNVTGVLSRSGDGAVTDADFSVSGLSIPLATFLAQRANIMPVLLAGDDTVFASNANGAVYGLAGNDTLIGGQGGNSLFGGDGNDSLLPGTATAFSGGQDFVDGGAGNDTISFAADTRGVLVDLAAGTASGIQDKPADFIRTSVTIVNVENATGGAGDDILIGNAGVNILTGGAGNDTLIGGAGADILDGGTGSDTADYSASNAGITVNLTTGVTPDGDRFISIENVTGSLLDDVMTGSGDDNVFNGRAGNDQIFGLAGNDTLNGQAGDDALFGGAGNDVIGGGFGNDGLFGGAGNDQIYGGEGNDYIRGGLGDDVLWGELGNDQIIAGAGNDFAVLGAGDDYFLMGLGDDRLRFDYDNGRDTIADFNNGNDVIDFTFTDMTRAVLINNAVETSQGILLNLGSGSILLAGLTWGQVDWNGSSDFIFA